MLTVLGGLAEFERELIRARTGECPSLSFPHCMSFCVQMQPTESRQPNARELPARHSEKTAILALIVEE